MDDVTREVGDMYARFPYPSPQGRGRNLKELLNLFKIFSVETRYNLDGKVVLDAGTGSGHRLIEAARAFPRTAFVAVDISETSLAIARETASYEKLKNIEFKLFNVMDDHERLGTFDIILSMGVIHHLSDPARGLRNLAKNLSEDGLIFLYVYAKAGSQERMRRKQIVSVLLNGRAKDFDHGIRMVKSLGFDSFDYGWDLNFEDEASRNSLIVDAYLNVNETMFDSDGVFDLMKSSGLHSYLTYGLTLKKHGCLFDTRYAPLSRAMVQTTDIAARLGPLLPRDEYDKLSLADKYRLVDLYFEPNGYTLLGVNPGAVHHFSSESRISANLRALAAG